MQNAMADGMKLNGANEGRFVGTALRLERYDRIAGAVVQQFREGVRVDRDRFGLRAVPIENGGNFAVPAQRVRPGGAGL